MSTPGNNTSLSLRGTKCPILTAPNNEDSPKSTPRKLSSFVESRQHVTHNTLPQKLRRYRNNRRLKSLADRDSFATEMEYLESKRHEISSRLSDHLDPLQSDELSNLHTHSLEHENEDSQIETETISVPQQAFTQTASSSVFSLGQNVSASHHEDSVWRSSLFETQTRLAELDMMSSIVMRKSILLSLRAQSSRVDKVLHIKANESDSALTHVAAREVQNSRATLNFLVDAMREKTIDVVDKAKELQEKIIEDSLESKPEYNERIGDVLCEIGEDSSFLMQKPFSAILHIDSQQINPLIEKAKLVPSRFDASILSKTRCSIMGALSARNYHEQTRQANKSRKLSTTDNIIQRQQKKFREKVQALLHSPSTSVPQVQSARSALPCAVTHPIRLEFSDRTNEPQSQTHTFIPLLTPRRSPDTALQKEIRMKSILAIKIQAAYRGYRQRQQWSFIQCKHRVRQSSFMITVLLPLQAAKWYKTSLLKAQSRQELYGRQKLGNSVSEKEIRMELQRRLLAFHMIFLRVDDEKINSKNLKNIVQESMRLVDRIRDLFVVDQSSDLCKVRLLKRCVLNFRNPQLRKLAESVRRMNSQISAKHSLSNGGSEKIEVIDKKNEDFFPYHESSGSLKALPNKWQECVRLFLRLRSARVRLLRSAWNTLRLKHAGSSVTRPEFNEDFELSVTSMLHHSHFC